MLPPLSWLLIDEAPLSDCPNVSTLGFVWESKRRSLILTSVKNVNIRLHILSLNTPLAEVSAGTRSTDSETFAWLYINRVIQYLAIRL
jgi:hypothetical protein